MMNVDNITQAIRLAHLDSVESVETSIEDLVALVRHIEYQKAQLQEMSLKMVNKNIEISNLMAEGLMKPRLQKLDEYV